MVRVIEDISSLSSAEYAKLVATYYNSINGRDEDSSLDKMGYSPEALAEMRRIADTRFNPVTICGLRFTKPLNNFKSEIFNYACLLFQNYERGVLPFPGSLSEQPAQILEIFGTLQSAKIEFQDRERKRLEAESRRANKRKG